MSTPAHPWHQAPLFGSLRPEQRERLEAIARRRRLGPDQMLFQEGEPCSGFFVLELGAIQLTRVSETPGAHPTLAIVLPVASFAEAAMFGGEDFPVSATAIKPSVVVHFPKAPFLAALREDPALALAVIHAQAVWLRKLTQKVEQLTGSDSLGRLRRWLNEQLPLGRAFPLPMTKKALAAQLGMTPETLSRALRSLQDEGALEVQGREVTRRKAL